MNIKKHKRTQTNIMLYTGGRKMLLIDRRNMIIEYLEEFGSAKVEELSQKLNVTPMTIRRDLQYLEDNNIVSRTFGGAILKSGLTSEVPYKNKVISNMDEKKRIAKYAVSLVQNGQIVYLDSGTTNMEIAKQLKSKQNLTVVTNDIKIAGYLSFSSNFKILCTGGWVQNSTGTCLGSHTIEFLKGINVDIGFIGSSSVSYKSGLTTPTFEKADVKKQAIKSATKLVLVIDNSKFGKESFAKVCNLDEFDLVVTDAGLSEKTHELLKKENINVKLV